MRAKWWTCSRTFSKRERSPPAAARPGAAGRCRAGVRPVMPRQPQPAQIESDVGALTALVRRVGRRRQNQNGRRRADKPHSCDHAPDQHAVHSQIDRGIRCQCGVRQTGDASVALYFRGRRAAGSRPGVDRAGDTISRAARDGAGAQSQQQNQQRRNHDRPNQSV